MLGSQPSLSILPAHSAHCIGRSGDAVYTIEIKRRRVPARVSIVISTGNDGRTGKLGEPSKCDDEARAGRSECSYAE